MNLEEALERIEYLENLIYSPKKAHECAKDVISKYFDVDLNSRTRKTPVPLARFLYFAWCRNNTTSIVTTMRALDYHDLILNEFLCGMVFHTPKLKYSTHC